MLTETLKPHFSRAFGILEDAIGSFSEAAWREGSPSFNGPARAVAHLLQCAEYYTCENRDVFLNLGKKVWQLSDEELPSQSQMLEYLGRVRDMTLQWLTVGDDELLQPRVNKFSASRFDAALYALRHLQHHIGEICAYQKLNGLEPAEWR